MFALTVHQLDYVPAPNSVFPAMDSSCHLCPLLQPLLKFTVQGSTRDLDSLYIELGVPPLWFFPFQAMFPHFPGALVALTTVLCFIKPVRLFTVAWTCCLVLTRACPEWLSIKPENPSKGICCLPSGHFFQALPLPV